MKFGNTTISKSGCGVVTCYNILKLFGENRKFPDIIFECRANGMQINDGGITISKMRSYNGIDTFLDKHKIKYETYTDEKIFKKNMSRYKYYILGITNSNGTDMYLS